MARDERARAPDFHRRADTICRAHRRLGVGRTRPVGGRAVARRGARAQRRGSKYGRRRPGACRVSARTRCGRRCEPLCVGRGVQARGSTGSGVDRRRHAGGEQGRPGRVGAGRPDGPGPPPGRAAGVGVRHSVLRVRGAAGGGRVGSLDRRWAFGRVADNAGRGSGGYEFTRRVCGGSTSRADGRPSSPDRHARSVRRGPRGGHTA